MPQRAMKKTSFLWLLPCMFVKLATSVKIRSSARGTNLFIVAHYGRTIRKVMGGGGGGGGKEKKKKKEGVRR